MFISSGTGWPYDLLEKLFTEPDLALPWQWIIGAAFVPPKLALVGDRRGYEPLALLILVDHPDLRAKEPLHLIPQPRPHTAASATLRVDIQFPHKLGKRVAEN